jgi:hypothetical protein
LRAKKASESSRLIRYLLSADRKFQRISLKKVSPPAKRAKRPSRPTRAKHASPVKSTSPAIPSRRVPLAADRLALVAGVVCVMGAVALIAARQPSRGTDLPLVIAPAPPETAAESNTVRSSSAPLPSSASVPSSAPAVSAAPRETQAPTATPPGDTAKRNALKDPAKKPADAQVIRLAANKTSGGEPTRAVAPTPATDSHPGTVPAERAPAAAVESAASITLTGCLEGDAESFWLKDTSGTGAPTARSWKSGFLKKRTARVELVDSTRAFPMRAYIGQRVAATGVLMNREMQMRSLYRVAESCN